MNKLYEIEVRNLETGVIIIIKDKYSKKANRTIVSKENWKKLVDGV